jgi:hypothetical protein
MLVLLAGASHAGKTTLSVAVARKLGWKLLSEDLVVIDPSLRRIVPFIHPLSLRPGAQELVAEATGLRPMSLYLERWLACQNLFYKGENVSPRFSLSILIERDVINPILSLTVASSCEFLRALLPLSNALHIDNGPGKLKSSFDTGQCYILRNGSVAERLEILADLVSQKVEIEP